MTCDTSNVTQGTGNMTHDTGHATCGEDCVKMLGHQLKDLGLMVFQRFGGKG